ncbi:MAG: NAD-dependent epimerase/dehydratase family protein [Pseudomonadota bacterium]
MSHVLLTGATGFLGSHLLEALLKQGYRVSILKRSTSNTWRIDHLLEQVSAFDVDQVSIEEAFKTEKIDSVIHTACSYGRDGQSVYEVVETNLMLGLSVFDAAVRFNANVFLNTDSLLPKHLNTYSLSKKHFSEWLQQRSNEIKVINLRLEHMYGPKDDGKKFVPWLIGQLKKNVRRIPLTAGNQLRDFIYIDDVVSAYLLTLGLVETMPGYSEFDVGTGTLTRVKDFVESIYDIYKQQAPESNTQLGFGDIPMRDGELLSIELDVQPLMQLGWKTRFTQEQGLEHIMKEEK